MSFPPQKNNFITLFLKSEMSETKVSAKNIHEMKRDKVNTVLLLFLLCIISSQTVIVKLCMYENVWFSMGLWYKKLLAIKYALKLKLKFFF